MDGTKVHHTKFTLEVNEENIPLIKCVCAYCQTAYKKRPFLCRCSSNVFLRNVENGNYLKQ